jgi:hypothetical protein
MVAMQNNGYVKIVLTLICLFLAMIAFRPLLAPQRVAASHGEFSDDAIVLCSSCSLPGVSPKHEYVVFWDRDTGEVWGYDDAAFSGVERPLKWGELDIGRPVLRAK